MAGAHRTRSSRNSARRGASLIRLIWAARPPMQPPRSRADPAGNALLTGNTAGSFPTLNAAQNSFGGTQDAFVASFNGNGLLAYSTYLGGAGSEQAGGIAVDAADNVFVTGSAVAGFPLISSIQPFAGGGTDAYIAHYSPSGA